jgi:hypothetical protein
MKLKLRHTLVLINFALVACFVPTLFGSDDKAILDVGEIQPPRQIMRYEAGHEKFTSGLQSIYKEYLYCTKKSTLKEIWCIFYTLLEVHKKITPDKITEILKALTEEGNYRKSFKELLISWHESYKKDLIELPVLLLIKRAPQTVTGNCFQKNHSK